jgi:hypothetical protein
MARLEASTHSPQIYTGARHLDRRRHNAREVARLNLWTLDAKNRHSHAAAPSPVGYRQGAPFDPRELLIFDERLAQLVGLQ